jgi:uncharacterized protein YciI
MHFVIHCLDHARAAPLRLAHYEEHKAYLAGAAIGMVISGPLLGDDGETMIGSFFLVEAGSRDDVLAFHRGDPFHRAGLWAKVEIHPFLKRVDKRR